MSGIKPKLGLILVLLLSVVMIVPSASSKYVKHFRSIIRLQSEVASYNLWWNYGTGPVITSLGVADSTATSSIGNDGIITINSTTVPTLKSAGYYMLIAKGGNGGRGINMSTGKYTDNATCGYGGVVCGVYYLDPETTTLKVCLGSNGADAKKSYTTTSSDESAGKSSYTRDWGYNSKRGLLCPGAGGPGGGFPSISFTGAGGGAATWIFKDSIDTTNTLLIAAGGAASGSTKDGTVGFGQGGHGGSNVLDLGSNALAVTGEAGIGDGTVYSGIDGKSDGTYDYGRGGTLSGGDDGASNGGQGYTFGTGYYVESGVGGTGAQTDYLFGGGGGGGYSGGSGGETGGGGGSSYVSATINTSSTLVNKAAYISTMEDVFDIYFPGMFYYDDNTGLFYETNSGELERYSFFVLYYISSTAPASL